MVITPELSLHLNLLAWIDREYVSDLLLALFEHMEGIKQDPDEMPQPVKDVFNYWTMPEHMKMLRLPK